MGGNLLFKGLKSHGKRGLLQVALVLGLLPLSGCGWLDSLRKDDAEKPLELQRITEEFQLERLWRVNVGNGQGDKYNLLKPSLSGTRIFAASNDGDVMAVDAESGRTLWRQRTDEVITGAVGAANGLVLVGTENSLVLALSQDDGRELWRTRVSSEVLSAPVTNGRVVVVQTVDGKLIGLNAQSGAQQWVYENDVPALSLRGTSTPLIIENFVIAAMANGTVVSIATDNGTLRWEERVAIPTGRSEIERLVDIDGDVLVNDAGLVLVTSYQGYLSAIDAVTGQTRWRTEESSYSGNGFGFGNIYVADDQSRVSAYRTGQDDTVWSNEQLLRRQLSTPHGFSNYVAVGDYEGYVHLLSQVDGRIIARTRVDNDGVRGRMVSLGNTLYVYGNSGTLAALRVR